jgi:hypothetical protein
MVGAFGFSGAGTTVAGGAGAAAIGALFRQAAEKVKANSAILNTTSR